MPEGSPWHAPDPYLSLVIASRNDGYAGGMLHRLQVCIDAFLHQTGTFALPSELILVDWNPPRDRSLLDALQWPRTHPWCTVRVITVGQEIHAAQRFGDRLPILICRARNVGIRRARGRFVLPTSADILLSDELAAHLAAQTLDPSAMYRIARHDVPSAALNIEAHGDRLAYCRAHVMHVHGPATSYRIEGLPDLFTNGAGDFTLLSREMYFTLRGMPEEREFHSMHFDSVFCFQALAAGAREEIFAEPDRIYHVDHGVPSWQRPAGRLERTIARLPLKPRTAKRWTRRVRAWFPPKNAMDRRGMPSLNLESAGGRAQFEALVRGFFAAGGRKPYNDDTWGLGAHDLPERLVTTSNP